MALILMLARRGAAPSLDDFIEKRLRHGFFLEFARAVTRLDAGKDIHRFIRTHTHKADFPSIIYNASVQTSVSLPMRRSFLSSSGIFRPLW